MKTSSMLFAFASGALALAQSTASTPMSGLLPTNPPEPQLVEAVGEQAPALEPRQAQIVNPNVPGVTPANPLQYPSITTQFLPSPVGTTQTYVPIIYTQTFPAVPDQWPAPGSGSIGYGTLSKHGKRDAGAAPTAPGLLGVAGRLRLTSADAAGRCILGHVQSVVMQLETVGVTQYVQQVTAIAILRSVTVPVNTTDEPGYANGTGLLTFADAGNGLHNGTYHGFMNGTAPYGNLSAPASADFNASSSSSVFGRFL